MGATGGKDGFGNPILPQMPPPGVAPGGMGGMLPSGGGMMMVPSGGKDGFGNPIMVPMEMNGGMNGM